ncbi:MAG: hypothetical protein AB7O24_28565 [Kofleriaceae bacterium]
MRRLYGLLAICNSPSTTPERLAAIHADALASRTMLLYVRLADVEGSDIAETELRTMVENIIEASEPRGVVS